MSNSNLNNYSMSSSNVALPSATSYPAAASSAAPASSSQYSSAPSTSLSGAAQANWGYTVQQLQEQLRKSEERQKELDKKKQELLFRQQSVNVYSAHHAPAGQSPYAFGNNPALQAAPPPPPTSNAGSVWGGYRTSSVPPLQHHNHYNMNAGTAASSTTTSSANANAHSTATSSNHASWNPNPSPHQAWNWINGLMGPFSYNTPVVNTTTFGPATNPGHQQQYVPSSVLPPVPSGTALAAAAANMFSGPYIHPIPNAAKPVKRGKKTATVVLNRLPPGPAAIPLPPPPAPAPPPPAKKGGKRKNAGPTSTTTAGQTSTTSTATSFYPNTASAGTFTNFYYNKYPQQLYTDPGSSAAGSSTFPLPTAMVTTPAPATPPDWDKSCDSALQSFTPVIKIPVQQASLEYEVLAELVESSLGLNVTQIERVVNLTLWKKFVAVRKELMIAKSRDFTILSGLGLTDSELQQQCHIFFNFDPAPGIPDYSDNVALLFHCTRGSVDAILSQGLDDRLGRDTGLLGRGIYFADDPAKSVTYDGNSTFIVCAVFLGDCVQSNVSNVREPEKKANQMRNPSDLFFDSIVGRPGATGANEFVIYNRHQCVPLYLIHYGKNRRAVSQTDLGKSYTQARTGLPPFSWNPSTSASHILAPSHANRWPFFAQTIFKLMYPNGPHPAAGSPLAPISDKSNIEFQLAALRDLGFTDDKTNTEKLIEFGFNLELTIDALLTCATATPPASPSTNLPPPHQAANAPLRSAPPATSSSVAYTAAGAYPGTAINQPATSPTSYIDLTQSPSPSPAQPQPAPFHPQAQPSPPLVTAKRGQQKKVKLDTDNLSAVINAVASGKAGGQPLQAPKPDPSSSSGVSTSTRAIKDVTKPVPKPRGRPPKNPAGSAGFSTNEATSSTSAAATATSTSSAAAAASSMVAASPTLSQNNLETDDDCPICCAQTSRWTRLACSHNLCTDCRGKLLTSVRSMSGQLYTYIKCPFCNGVSGTELGTCPDGVMTKAILQTSLPGYESYGTISVNYVVSQGKYSLNRTGYLPSSPEGNRLFELLRTAWDRRLVFSIGTSITTGQSDVLVWNIHHKTAMSGGVQSYGYPDPTYLDRLLGELKQYGIE